MGAGRVGVMGGGFDPPHMFHVAIAERAREFLGLDIVVFLPADSSPPKFGSRDRSKFATPRRAPRAFSTRLTRRGFWWKSFPERGCTG